MRLKWTENGNATTMAVCIFEWRIMEDVFKYPFLGIANSEVFAFLRKNRVQISA